jgi:hypothetical protein
VAKNRLNKQNVATLRQVVELRKRLKIDHIFDRALARHIWLVSPTKTISYASGSSYITATSNLGTVTFGANGDSLGESVIRALQAFTSIGMVSKETIQTMEVS